MTPEQVMGLRQILQAPLKDRPPSRDAIRYLSMLFAFNAVIRGADYVTDSSAKVADIVTIGTVISTFVNLQFWGWIFLVFGIELILALILKRHFFVFLGHGMLLAAYALLMVSSSQAVYHLHDDYRALAVPLGGLAFHGWRAFSIKPWPREVIAPLAASRDGTHAAPEEDREEYL